MHGVDILINNVGAVVARELVWFSDLGARSKDFWEQALHPNLLGAFPCTRVSANALREAKGPVESTAFVAGLGASRR